MCFIILLDGPFTDTDTQLEQFATDPLRSPDPILRHHLLDQDNGLCSYFRLMRVGLGSALPNRRTLSRCQHRSVSG
jgi:hypothetical protein